MLKHPCGPKQIYIEISLTLYIAWKSLNSTEDYLFLEDLTELTCNLTV